MNHTPTQAEPEQTCQLSPAAARVLSHITARTITGRFAARLYDMPRELWDEALDELRRAGQRIEWIYGQVADDPTVTGGYILVEVHHAGVAQTASVVSKSDRPDPIGRPGSSDVTSLSPQEQMRPARSPVTRPVTGMPRDLRATGR